MDRVKNALAPSTARQYESQLKKYRVSCVLHALVASWFQQQVGVAHLRDHVCIKHVQ